MVSKTPKKSEYMEFRLPRLLKDTPTTIFLLIVAMVFSFLLGMLTNKVLYLENAKKIAALQTTPPAAQQTPPAAPTEDTTPKQVSIDNDPILGEKNAKVTLIEFSDYECPFCKRYFDETYEKIKTQYIDTGKIKLVYRDLPLSFHANAPKEAQAAECAREQGGDSVYYQYHDEIFKRTTSNGTGLALDQLSLIANELGLNGDLLQSCIDSDKYKSEVEKDIADAGVVGATGTPTFFIGKSTNNGTITGTKLVGAQPFSAFQALIEKELKK
ncbi:MAG TPA: thioredoxin domain-containing protein [Candidatus Limnocylindrales bacterium]|nr:thioredoxin domain-containing protein [Candidatus Limnocylindrales bacterium]